MVIFATFEESDKINFMGVLETVPMLYFLQRQIHISHIC